MLLFVLRYGFQQVHKRCACHRYLLLIFSRKWRRYSGKLHHEVSLQRGENVSLCVSMINCKIVVVISLLIKMYECLEREKKKLHQCIMGYQSRDVSPSILSYFDI